MVDFSDINFSKLNLENFNSLITREDEVLPGFEFCKYFGLISSPRQHVCVNPKCDGEMFLQKRSQLKLKFRYFCHKCNQTVNLAQYTWFSNSHLSILLSLKLIYLWTSKCTVHFTATALGLNRNTVVNQFSMLRELCINKCTFNNSKIGGEGEEVEIDETKVFHRKNHKGRLLLSEKKKSWVIGGIERNSNACFAELVPDRGSETIKELVLRRVEKKTRILTDRWKAYLCLRQLGYTVDQVNHSKNFVDPSDRTINTQKIERSWRSLKKCLPKSSSGDKRSTYIEEFVYRKTYFSRNIGENFKLLLKDIAEFYPGCFLD